jgi:ribosomal protein L21
VFKHKRRKGYRRKAGHRQAYTALRIDHIKL